MENAQFSKYERARILGARSLQIAMDAPILTKISEEMLSSINFDPLRIAEIELDSGVLPISVVRPMPQKSSESIEKVKVETPAVQTEDKKIEEVERKEEKEVSEESEMMELATPEDETEEQDYESGETATTPEELT